MPAPASETSSPIDFAPLISARARAIDVSGIRRVFELGAKLKDPINLSIGQPDFPVPDPIKRATINAIESNHNGYTLTQGAPELLHAVSRRLASELAWDAPSDETGLIITSGTSGALTLAFLALLNPGDEIIIGDPYFVIYPALAEIAGASAVFCDTYPDFRLTAERVRPLISERTRIVLVNSPGNPSGAVLDGNTLRDLQTLCEERSVLLIADEIYDEFTYSESREAGRCPSPARFSRNLLLVRGFGKTYGCTGWRLGYAAGPRAILQQMAKLQQYMFVCAPSMAQHGAAASFDVEMTHQVGAYQHRRNMVVDAFTDLTDLQAPGGAFYAFVRIPEGLGMTATQFAERAVERNVLVIPGSVFSQRDTHFRLSFAVSDAKLREGLSVLREMLASR